MRQAEIPRQSQMRHTRAKKRLVSIDKLKEILFGRNRLHKGNFTVLRAVGYLLNVMAVLGTFGVLVMASHTKSHGIASEKRQPAAANRLTHKGAPPRPARTP